MEAGILADPGMANDGANEIDARCGSVSTHQRFEWSPVSARGQQFLESGTSGCLASIAAGLSFREAQEAPNRLLSPLVMSWSKAVAQKPRLKAHQVLCCGLRLCSFRPRHCIGLRYGPMEVSRIRMEMANGVAPIAGQSLQSN